MGCGTASHSGDGPVTLAAMQQRIAARLVGLDQTAIPGIAESQLELAKELLIRKRLGEVAPLLPRCRQTLGTRFGELFRHFVREHQPHGLDKPTSDAIAFAAMIADERTLPRWQRDLAAYEAAWSSARRATPLFIALRCAHPLDSTDDAQGRGPFLAFWWRWHRRGALHHLRLRGIMPCGHCADANDDVLLEK